MRLRLAATGVVLVALFGPASAQSSLSGAEEAFSVLSRRVAAGEVVPEEQFDTKVDLAGDNLDVRADPVTGRWRILFRMNFNQVAEGWSWRPLADPAVEDYYRFKYLPLGTRDVQQGESYRAEDLPGRSREFRKVIRYAYYLAFENPYDFFPRPKLEDDAGFTLELPAGVAGERIAAPGGLRMRARAVALSPYFAESTTFWRATDGNPTELTLKNRYLIGRLQEVRFEDADGNALGKLIAVSARP